MLGRSRSWGVGLTALVLVAGVPLTASAIVTLSLRDLTDPVPPGGILTYRVNVRQTTPPPPPTPPTPLCFNPPPDCVIGPATCSNPPPFCGGDPILGYSCRHALNEGANCGVGSPLTPDASLCVPREYGTCNGGNNVGLPCSAPNNTVTEECPGSTYVCVRSFNDGDYCGTGTTTTTTTLTPPSTTTTLPQTVLLAETSPDVSYCIQNPIGICDSGPNVGLPCMAPHLTETPDCPNVSTPPPPPLGPFTVTLPIPAGTTFLDADSGGTSDGTNVTWTMQPHGACGVPGTPRCPQVIARMTVDPLTPVGTVIQNQASAADADGTTTSGIVKTTVGTFHLRRLALVYSKALDRDRVKYVTVFTLPPGVTIDPPSEPLSIRIHNASGTIFETAVPAGGVFPSSTTSFTFATVDPLARGLLRERGPSHYFLSLRVSRASLPLLATSQDLQVTVTLTFGTDVLDQQVTLLSRRGGKAFVATQ
jgi:hypothetical protein